MSSNISYRVIDGISSNLANTFLSSRQILKIKTKELGAIAIRVTSLCNYTPGIYAEGYIVFVFPFVRSSVRMFVRLFVRTSVPWICVKVLR